MTADPTGLVLNGGADLTVDVRRSATSDEVAVVLHAEDPIGLTSEGARLLAAHLLRCADAIDDGWAPAATDAPASPAAAAATPESSAS